jgi:hypothetical protein
MWQRWKPATNLGIDEVAPAPWMTAERVHLGEMAPNLHAFDPEFLGG